MVTLCDVAELRLAFALFDKDGDGAINYKEMQAVFTALELPESSQTVKQMLEKFDKDGKGYTTTALGLLLPLERGVLALVLNISNSLNVHLTRNHPLCDFIEAPLHDVGINNKQTKGRGPRDQKRATRRRTSMSKQIPQVVIDACMPTLHRFSTVF